MSNGQPRRWHQLSLRALFILTTASAAGLAGYRWFRLPSIHVASNVIDVGDVKGGMRGINSFDVHNGGRNEVQVEHYRWPSMGGFQEPRVAIPAGQTRKVTVEWRVSKNTQLGEVIWNYDLATSDPNQPWLTVTIKGRRIP